RPHRDLRPLPTRRSSDLSGRRTTGAHWSRVSSKRTGTYSPWRLRIGGGDESPSCRAALRSRERRSGDPCPRPRPVSGRERTRGRRSHVAADDRGRRASRGILLGRNPDPAIPSPRPARILLHPLSSAGRGSRCGPSLRLRIHHERSGGPEDPRIDPDDLLAPPRRGPAGADGRGAREARVLRSNVRTEDPPPRPGHRPGFRLGSALARSPRLPIGPHPRAAYRPRSRGVPPRIAGARPGTVPPRSVRRVPGTAPPGEVSGTPAPS